MIKIKFKDEEIFREAEFSQINKNIVQLLGDIPTKTSGFYTYRQNEVLLGDFTDYSTVYKQINGGCQFSNDGTVYVEPEPIEPYIPTLEEIQEAKVTEINMIQQTVIQQGIDVTLTDGTVEHFTLTDHDQTSLMGLQVQVAQGAELIPWHTSDQSEHCKFYSNADMALITAAAMSYVTWHVTYFRDLRIYIRSLQTKEEIETVVYGMDIPTEYQSEPLQAMLAGMGA